MTPEGRVKAKIKKALDTLPKVYRFMPVQQGFGAPALDFYVCVNGHFVGIEAKAPGKTATGRQMITAANIRAAHGLTFLIDGDDSLNYMMAILRTL